jgi:hypothetical protein
MARRDDPAVFIWRHFARRAHEQAMAARQRAEEAKRRASELLALPVYPFDLRRSSIDKR